MASPFEPRVPVAAELKVVAIRVGEMVEEMEAITVEVVQAEEETAVVVTEATAVAEMGVADTATTVERTREVVTVMVTEEGTGTIDRNPSVTYLISRISNLL
jgi:hypothetical protein